MSRILHFVGVADALALVRVGRTDAANLRRNLSDLLLVDSAYSDLRLVVDLDVDPIGNREVDRMREAELQHELLAFQLGPVSDAFDAQVAQEPLVHTGNRVRRQGACEAVEGPRLLAVVGPREAQFATLLDHADPVRDRGGQVALRAADSQRHSVLLDGDSVRQRDWVQSDS